MSRQEIAWKSEKKSGHGFRWGVAGVFTVFGLTLADQLTKLLAIRRLKSQASIVLIPTVLELFYLENRGMAFGLFQGKIPFFVIMCLVFFCAFLYAWIKIPKNRYYAPLTAVLYVLVSGALGNFIDRIFRGYVVDFIYVSLIDFPVFNLADVYVVCGGILLLLLVCFYYKDDDDFAFLKPGKRS